MRFLEFQINSESFFLFYSDRQVECLDRVRSDITYFQSSDRVMMVDRYEFRPGLINDCDIFTVPELRGGMFFWGQETFVTPSARAEIERAGLVGFWFAPLPGLVPEF